MITDRELRFFDKAAIPAVSDVVNVGKGDASRGDPIYLYVHFNGAPATAATVKIKTSDDSGMTGAVEIGSSTVAAADVQKGGVVLKAALPNGCKKFLSIDLAGPASGTVSAGLVLGVDDMPLISGWN